MDGILLILAALCAVYFVIIVIYGESALLLPLYGCFAALCVFLVYGKWYYSRHMFDIPKWVPVSIVTTCVMGVTVMAMICTLVFLGVASEEEPGLDYVIVLGAKVKEHTVSNSLKNGWIRPLTMPRKIRKPIWCFQGKGSG